MTSDNQRANIRADLERGDEALRAAQLLLTHGMFADCVSRAYYGMLYHARAMLLTEGLEPRTHGGVAHFLHLNFVRAGAFPPDQARSFSRLQADREDADYESGAVFTAEAATDVLEQAQSFSKACRDLVENRGFGCA